jgi:glycosyltransferase involved in cell wall biosynthesis
MDLIDSQSQIEFGTLRASPALLPISVIVPVRNEARNLPRCLESLASVGEVYVIDSQSTDSSVSIAASYGAKIEQFHYRGGWPKKRQWAIDTLPLAFDWILLLDADEVLTGGAADSSAV